jgi:hypothetical protein
MITNEYSLNFLWQDVNIPIRIATNHNGLYAVVDGMEWDKIHPDDLCNSTIAMIEFLLDSGYGLNDKWYGYLDETMTPTFWLKES